MHVPVLLDRCVELLAPAVSGTDAVLVDATLGLGGHSEAFLERFPRLRVVGIDRDPQARSAAEERLAPFGARFEARDGVHENLAAAISDIDGGRVQAVLFDLGVSSMQLDQPVRGFSYSRDAPLDMRMNPADDIDAATIVNEYSQSDLVDILRRNGEERSATRIAAALVKRREQRPFTSTADLAQVVSDAIPAPAKRRGGNPAKRTFQALRIEVNRELIGLPLALDQALDALVVGGRIAVISYHSLEDRIVKRRFVAHAQVSVPPSMPVIPDDSRPLLRLLTRGAEVPSDSETGTNPRSASAKLRAAEKLREAA